MHAYHVGGCLPRDGSVSRHILSDFKLGNPNTNGEIFLGHASVENVGTGSIICKLDPQGDLLWATRIHSPRHGGYTLLQSLVPVGDGIYAIGETTEFGHKGYFHYHSFIARLDGSGSVEWIRTLGKSEKAFSGKPGEELGLAGALLPDGGVLLLGTTDAFSTAYDAFAARIGPNGAVSEGGSWLIAPDVSSEKQVTVTSPQVIIESLDPEPSPVKMLVKEANFETVAGVWKELAP